MKITKEIVKEVIGSIDYDMAKEYEEDPTQFEDVTNTLKSIFGEPEISETQKILDALHDPVGALNSELDDLHWRKHEKAEADQLLSINKIKQELIPNLKEAFSKL